MLRFDLHCHTTCSDGTMTPSQLVEHAQEMGLSGLSITDHDTTAAYEEALPIAKSLGIRLGIGAEFSSFHRNMSVHILAYDFDLHSPSIASLCKRHRDRRQVRNKRILEKLSRIQMYIAEEELPSSDKTIGRPHIAEVMVAKKYVKTIKEAFDLYIGDGRVCFDAGDPISSEETIAIIHEGGGKAFVAHPHLFRHSSRLKELLKLPFDGLECYYGRFTEDVSSRFLRMAEGRKWLVSGGSDFHGSLKEYLQLGCSWVDENRFEQIFQRL